MKFISSRFLAAYVGIAILLADFLSKFFVQQFLPKMNHFFLWYPYGGIGVFKDFLGIEFTITHATNKGAAWGILSDWQQPLLYFRLFLIAFLFIYIVFFNKRRSWEIPFVMILAGAIANVVDYFLYGHVIDMLHFVFWGYSYPVFNIADASIFIGVAWLLISSSLDKSPVKMTVGRNTMINKKNKS